jgi:hypothetical protein
MDQRALTTMLDSALLTPAEVQRGIKGWSRLPDPFPVWGRQVEVA